MILMPLAFNLKWRFCQNLSRDLRDLRVGTLKTRVARLIAGVGRLKERVGRLQGRARAIILRVKY